MRQLKGRVEKMNQRTARMAAIVVILSLAVTALALPASEGLIPTKHAVSADDQKSHIPGSLNRAAPSPAEGANVTLNYDEQLGLTYTQDLSTLSFNVTAVEQSFNDSYGAGPGYLVCGLSNTGYWYEVGLSWNWPYSNGGYNSGFSLMYEVFDYDANSIFPTNGQLGLLNFSAPVNANDNVNLQLSFSGGSVVMAGYDYKTKSSASQNFSAEGATEFIGLPSAIDNQNGFFTGLLTEQYHASEYFGNTMEVVYSETSFAFSSAWMWMDEYNAATNQIVFFDTSLSPFTFSNPTQLQEYSENGATEYSDAYEFITGPLASTTTSTTTTSTTTPTNSASTSSTTTSTSSSSSSATNSPTTTTVTSTATSVTTLTTTATVIQTSSLTTISTTTLQTTATSTVSQTVTTTLPPTTVTSTQPVTSTQTTTSTQTVTTTLPPLTVTSSETGPTTTVTGPTTTETSSETVTSTTTTTNSSLPALAYAVMGLLLIVGLALGYIIGRPARSGA